MSPKEKILELLKTQGAMSLDQIYEALNESDGFSIRVVKEAILSLREEGKIKPNKSWLMEYVDTNMFNTKIVEIDNKEVMLLKDHNQTWYLFSDLCKLFSCDLSFLNILERHTIKQYEVEDNVWFVNQEGAAKLAWLISSKAFDNCFKLFKL